MKNVVIAAYARSPFTPANKGALMTVRADDMTAQVIKALIAKSGIDANDIEDLILGCAFPEGEQGMNMARLIVSLGELPISIAGVTLNRFCGSSMQAIHFAAGAIQMNAGEAFICAGVESMSRVPMGGFNYLPNPELYQRYPQAYMSMGETAENLAQKYNISRIDQEAFALLSQQKAYMAQQQGLLSDEIIPIVSQRGETIAQDGCLRPDSSAAGMAELNPAFSVQGSVTAATSSPLTDGAAAVLVCSEDYADTHGLDKLARIKSIAVSACLPEIMGIGPVSATQKALQRANLTLADMDIVELNEAFSAQSLAVLHDLPIAAEKLNIDGGAIALGHPLGATGARITGKAASLLQREDKQYALATQCIGGGQGIATILEAVS
ncbi:MAG TPA: thiolase family protein [Methyloprofundus sp.]|jgi:acetyl-CoA acyltransferase|uniref:thiolase family protein n=1 Tax=Methyloprofundus sp. TaxID=2020875 RepID=UPI0017C29484|nr:thiolase family protein [Methyloprofundus sp.]MBT5221748.1 thiolase family protein [Gammaproteobacteria bacterium]HIL79006.1 thiolase family protein [Methylococcales bacterium]MBT5826450.1 thiolase family protein [Gammaproteobacteria bacterium]MBT5966219.1 thiolase family protein [Gammaproteobacteria bacterium]MBT6420238.1 thiolase family protein [Gammaproteobacteria bacterium]